MALLDQALDQPADQCEAWLRHLDADPLLPWLRELLGSRARIETAGFLRAAPVWKSDAAEPAAGPVLTAGECVGAYRLVRAIGTGGMGQVWLAERADGLFERPVALKLPHGGAFGATFAQRLGRERDILAALDHPNIARLLDAGLAHDGQPYLALQYVEGERIDAHCDSRRLGVPARLRLFVQVARAVAHAHARLVIHRDLKPSNVLVTPDGRVSLLDFGIAKLLAPDGLASQTELTQFGGVALTPDYAAPEQIEGLPLTTAADIYALGVLLFELLAGARPYALRRKSRAELEAAIAAVDVPRPSGVVTDAAAALRGTTAARLRRQIRGDLDTIVLEALKKAPGDRYESAAALADDIERHLQGQAVLARPDSIAYSARKFVLRHKLETGIAAAALVAIVGGAYAQIAVAAALAAGSGLALWQARVARRQTAVAERQARHARAAMSFVTDMLRTAGVEQDDPLRARRTTAEELVRLGASRIRESLHDAPEVQEQVMDTLATMYFEMGLADDAARMRKERIELLRRIHGPDDRRIADALLTYAVDAADTRNRAQTAAALAEVERILTAVRDKDSATLGRLWVETARFDYFSHPERCRRYADRAVEFFRVHADPDGYLIDALRHASKSRLALGDAQGAEALNSATLAEVQRRHPGETNWMVAPLAEQGEVRLARLDIAGAEQSLGRALDIATRRYGPSHIDTLYTGLRMAILLHATGRRAQARERIEAIFEALNPGAAGASGAPATVLGVRAALRLVEGNLDGVESGLAADVAELRASYPGSLALARRLVSQAEFLIVVGRLSEAARALAEAQQLWSECLASDAHASAFNPLHLAAGSLALARGEPQRAIDAFARVARPQGLAADAIAPDGLRAELGIVEAESKLARHAEAMTRARAAVGSIRGSPLRSYFPAIEADALLQWGEAEHLSGADDPACVHLASALELWRAIEDRASPRLARAQTSLAGCLLALGRRAEAAELVHAAQAIVAGHLELGEQFKLPLRAVELARLSA